MPEMNVPIDVICKHTKEGDVIPIKFKVQDDEGEYQTYVVKAYRKATGDTGEVVLPNGVIVTSHLQPFECKIRVFNIERVIWLYYNKSDGLWLVKR